MRKAAFCLVTVCCLAAFHNKSAAQGSEFGLSLGLSTFYGDLGGANNIGRPLFFDFEGSEVRPVVSLVYRKVWTRRLALKTAVFYTVIGGNDKLLQPKYEYAPEWYRWYRNLNFKTNLFELSSVFELNLFKYAPGTKKYPFTPYIFAGAGIFHFNPKGLYNGQWYELKPLHTEGQGFPEYPERKEYSLLQVCFPVGFGFRFNAGQHWTLGLEYRDRITLTDYIDDVSTTYIDPAAFYANISDPATAALAEQISLASDELDPFGENAVITAPGQQRGDPNDWDQYIFTGVITLAYFIPSSKAPYYPHSKPLGSFNCVKSWKKKMQ